MNFKESKAIYLQIADRICDEILLGQYQEEERIPSDTVREESRHRFFSDSIRRKNEFLL